MKKIPLRYVTLFWVAGVFLVVNTLARAGLIVFDRNVDNVMPLHLLQIFGVGAIYDLAALCYVLPFFALLALVWPNNAWGRKAHATVVGVCFALATFGMLFVVISEFIFWNEFSSRFNFIAVDYLIYMREVSGNIRESYPVGAILGVLGLITAAFFFFFRKPLWRAASGDGGRLRWRTAISGAVFALPVCSFYLIDDALHEKIATPSVRELAANGYYEFMRAFRSNDLDYSAFYKVLPAEDVRREVQAHLPGSRWTDSWIIERKINTVGAAKPLNVVLVSIESLGADYVESYGGLKGLTPNLDRFAAQGMMFTNLYATGLRTVRGLEALTLSIPPTPGHAVPVRKNNKGFQTIGGVFRDQGYESIYVYGGYSYFDNMQDFFGGNGYTVIDRTAIDKKDISHETIWGVADEDLFRLAVREIDQRVLAGKKVFAHVMTTSNHRPFTYPVERIDIPSGKNRDGAVKYTDWAIGQFIKDAATRPWFKNTVFILVADHTSHGRGRANLSPENYHIPMIIYAPGIVPARRIDTLASQLDVAPTILALLNIGYTSHFYGHDILSEGRQHQRAFMSNYLTVGMLRDGMVVELSPKQRVNVVRADNGSPIALDDAKATTLVRQAIANYQSTSEMLREHRAATSTKRVSTHE